MYSKIALASSTRVFCRFRFSSSTSMRPQKESATALSQGSPTVPSEGCRPAFLALEVNEGPGGELLPWSPWMIPPGEGRREPVAMPRALAARSARWAVSMAQPTMGG
jgi:hypothetical protein